MPTVCGSGLIGCSPNGGDLTGAVGQVVPLGVQSLLLAVLEAGVGEFPGRQRYARWVGAAYALGWDAQGLLPDDDQGDRRLGGVGDADTARDR